MENSLTAWKDKWWGIPKKVPPKSTVRVTAGKTAYSQVAKLVDAIDGYSTMGKKAHCVWLL